MSVKHQVIFILLTVTLLCHGQLTDISKNNGFHLIELGECKIKNSEHLIYYNFDISQIETEFIKVTDTLTKLQNQLENKEYFFQNVLNILKYNYADLKDQVTKLFLRNNKRPKRGLINGLGSIIKAITGNLDSTDEEKYNKLFAQIQSNEITLQKQNELNLQTSTNISKHFNQQLENIKHNEEHLQEKLTLIINKLNKNQDWQSMMAVNNQILELILIIKNLNEFCKQIETSLTFCSLHKIHPSIITYQNLKKITQNEDIWNLNELIETHCKFENKQIHFLITIPNFSKESYPLFQFSPIPTYDDEQKLITINENQKLFFKIGKENYIINNCVFVENKYMCVTQYFEISKCMLNLIDKKKDDNCLYHYISMENDMEQIRNTNDIIIISPNKQQIQINCLNKNIYKDIRGIFKMKTDEKCQINKNIFEVVNQQYKEIQIQNLEINYENKVNGTLNLKKIEKMKDSLAILPKLKDLEINNNYHSYVIHILIIVIIIICICILILRYKKILCINLCKKDKIEEKEIELNPLA